MSSTDGELPPHVLIFPLPAQGHINSMLNLAQLLCLASFDVTFIVTEFNHRRLLQHAPVNESSLFSRFQFQTIPDGLPDDHPRAGEKAMDVVSAVIDITGPLFPKLLIENDLFASADRRPVTCIIADGVLGFAADFAEANGIPLIFFRTASACYLWAMLCADKVIDASEVPINGNGMEKVVSSIPGMEGFLRGRDLPSFFRLGPNGTDDSDLQVIAALTRQTVRAQALILNTFEGLEDPILSNIRELMPKLYTVGPSNIHLKSRLAEIMDVPIISSSLWMQDQSCIRWLDAQKPRSVIYVSFGSITVMTREQVLEFWHGLVSSGHKFLWVIRTNSIKDGHQIPDELVNDIEGNGYMVEWAPQEEVLCHPAVGGFLTHSGWNSILESIASGVTMICWPYFADQTINSRYVSEVWKLGLDIKDTCDRVVIENAVKELMETKKDEFLNKASHFAKLAKEAISEGGSSYTNLHGLIDYIKSLII